MSQLGQRKLPTSSASFRQIRKVIVGIGTPKAILTSSKRFVYY